MVQLYLVFKVIIERLILLLHLLYVRVRVELRNEHRRYHHVILWTNTIVNPT